MPNFAHLHVKSWFSFLSAGSSPEALVHQASLLGFRSLALTDRHGVYGAVRFQQACREAGIKPIIGAELRVGGEYLVLLAASQAGYGNLCQILTLAHKNGYQQPDASLQDLAAHTDDLFCLTATKGGRLWRLVDGGRRQEAVEWIEQLSSLFGNRLSIEAAHHLLPGDSRRVRRLHRLSRYTGVSLVATGDVLYAHTEAYRTFDLLTCVREGIQVFDPHEDRPKNAEQCLKTKQELLDLIPYPEAFQRAASIAKACNVDLIPGYISPPGATVPPGHTAREYLKDLCYDGLSRCYPHEMQGAAAAQLEKELQVIGTLDLQEYFLVIHEVVAEARRRGIRCTGRGSAANSIVCYVLGITGVDPLKYNLLFERFLHAGRQGTPDVDLDFDAERRNEILEWIEERFSTQHCAMTATLHTYQLRLALRDAGKALGWSVDEAGKLSKAVPHQSAKYVDEFRAEIEGVLGPSRLTETLLQAVKAMAECPRHLSLHVGGMILTRQPISNFTPVQRSANGLAVSQFAKDDVEALGLIKLDCLGLRMLASISETVELIHRHVDPGFDLETIPLDDPGTFNLIRSSRTLAAFQIESPGQMNLLGRIQPEHFEDLIVQVALFRPGPVQGNLVHPYVRRRTGREKVSYEHPDLEPILRRSLGILLYQEQVLEIVSKFAGLDIQEADHFRRFMTKARDARDMEAMRAKFVNGALKRGVPYDTANSVFDKVRAYAGYGFSAAHAAAFAKLVYVSCYLKRCFPAAYMASVMQARPGMFPLMSLEQEARHCGVRVLPPDIDKSGVRYDLEPGPDGRLAIRKPLTAITSLSVEDAQAIFLERLRGPYTSIEDLYTRVALNLDVFRNLARSGALDAMAGDGRRALWEVGLLSKRIGKPGQKTTPKLFDLPAIAEDDIPDLPYLTLADRVSWDLETHAASRVHPMVLARRHMNSIEVRSVETLNRIGRVVKVRHGNVPLIVRTAGVVTLRIRPPTAKGVLFLVIEDETGIVQAVVRPEILERLDQTLRSSALIIQGELIVAGNWRGVILSDAWPLDSIVGGYEGHPQFSTGQDTWVRSIETERATHP
jgi:error-prone DNA polymerase